LYLVEDRIRDDGRVYRSDPPAVGHPDIEEVGKIQGHNHCLSEFHSAILHDRLQHLDAENQKREQNAMYLKQMLAEIGDVFPLRRLPQVTTATYYHFCVRLNLEGFGNHSIEVIRQALMAELNIFMEPVDDPLNNNVLFNPLRSPRTSKELKQKLDPSRFNLPVASQARVECLTFPHFALLADRMAMEDIATAFAKVKENHQQLNQVETLN